MKKLSIATVFSGIGAPEQALIKQHIKYEIMFACDNGERELPYSQEEITEQAAKKNVMINNYVKELYNNLKKENYVKKSYFANYDIDEDRWSEDIRFLNGKPFKDKIDLFIGGSPCQSFSISGKRLGLEDTRGTLFYEYARLVDEMQPKVFIYENVPGMLNHDKGNTWKVISEIFDSLNYSWKLYSLKATDFGIPQNRTRIFVIGFKNSLGIDPNDIVLETKELDVEVKDFLEEYVDDKYYHGEKGFKWITKPLSLKKRVSINSKIARTQAANQQFNWCGDMIFESNPTRIFPSRVYHGEFNGEYGVARKLTPRECLRLMGFSDKFKIVVPDQQMYRQAGNSIVVNVLESIINGVIKTGVFGK